MELIIDFYKNLDMLNLIIFWGIIIVIILLLIFSAILTTKNKKVKKTVINNNKQQIHFQIKEETIPIKIIKEEKENSIESTKQFTKDNRTVVYNNELQKNYSNSKNQITPNHNIDIKTTNERPRAPYQRNVLREMSLSQTSPIGINRQEQKMKNNKK